MIRNIRWVFECGVFFCMEVGVELTGGRGLHLVARQKYKQMFECPWSSLEELSEARYVSFFG